MDRGLKIGKNGLYKIGSVDLRKDDKFKWTFSTSEKAKKEMPFIHMIEYQQTQSAAIRDLGRWTGLLINVGAKLTAAAGSDNDLQGTLEGVEGINEALEKTSYSGLYRGTMPTGNSFILPFYSTYNSTITNSWDSSVGPLGTFLSSLSEKLKAISPNVGIEFPKGFSGTGPMTYSFEFYLYNIVDDNLKNSLAGIDFGAIDNLNNIDSINSAISNTKNSTFANNLALIKTLKNNNLFYRDSPVTFKPPVIYEISIPGIRYALAATINSLTITNEGQLNYIEGVGNIPDAYKLTFNIEELVVESRNIFQQGSKVKTGMSSFNNSNN